MMAGRRRTLDKVAKEGMLFTDLLRRGKLAQRVAANFITRRVCRSRTGMTTVGQAGAAIGLPAEACTMPRLSKR